MGLAELLDRLERDTDARVEAIEAHARAELEAIAAEAQLATSHALDEVLAERRHQRRRKHEVEIAEARQRARGDRLRAEHAMLQRVMTRAAELLDATDRDPAYLSTVPERLAQALAFVQGHSVVVRCRPTLAPAVLGAIGGRSDVRVEQVPGMAVGLSVATSDGSVEVDDTLPARLGRSRPRILVELLAEVAP